MTRFLLAAGVLAGCATPSALVESTPGPADGTVSAPVAAISLDALAPVEQPDLPRVLRPSMDHATMDHATMDHATMTAEVGSADGVEPAALASAVEAYLVIHAALASDTVEGVAGAARTFEAAFASAIEEAPADAPHLWHMRAAETSVVLTQARRLAAAQDLVAAREAFGELSPPFAALLDAVGTDGLVRHTCGMQSDAPDGGVWLQRAGDPANPYFGAAMQMCSREQAPLSDAPESDGAHEGMNHGDTTSEGR